MFTIKVNVGDEGMALDKPQPEIAKGNRERVRLVFEGTGDWADIEHTSGFTVTFSDGTEVTSDCGSCFVPQELFDLDEFGFTVKMGDLTSANGVTIALHVQSSGCTCEGGLAFFDVEYDPYNSGGILACPSFAEVGAFVADGKLPVAVVKAEAHGAVSCIYIPLTHFDGGSMYSFITVGATLTIPADGDPSLSNTAA